MNKKRTIKIKHKIAYLLVIVFICIVIVIPACSHPKLQYLGKYTFDIITLKDSSVRKVDNPNWATKMDISGLPNLHKISDNLYRGAQPTKEGMQELEKLGIKTVINLRSEHSDSDEMENVNLAYANIRMTTANPETENIVRFLNIVTDSNNAPVFVHCKYGADRTGTVCAIYRIVVQDWSKEDAIEEMTKGGYGFHSIWGNLVDYIRDMDIEKIKQLGEER